MSQDATGEAYLRYGDECRARGRHPLSFEDWASRRQPGNSLSREEIQHHLAREHGTGRHPGHVGGASVGRVDGRQAGAVTVSDDMVRRAQDEGSERGQLLDARLVRAMLVAALSG